MNTPFKHEQGTLSLTDTSEGRNQLIGLFEGIVVGQRAANLQMEGTGSDEALTLAVDERDVSISEDALGTFRLCAEITRANRLRLGKSNV